MNIADAELFLDRNGENLLAGGISGAKVYDIAGKYVYKHVRRAELKNDELYKTYCREAFWYECTMSDKAGFRLGFLPEILEICYTDEEIQILMKRYRTIPRENINGELLRKIMAALAAVHTTTVPLFLQDGQQGEGQDGMDWKRKEIPKQQGNGLEVSEQQGNGLGVSEQQEQGCRIPESVQEQQENQKKKPEVKLLSAEEIENSLAGWRGVLQEHPGAFDEAPLARIAEKINDIIQWHAKENMVLSHGDFHWDNLLQDEQGNILFCDWQGVSVGAESGDLSFLFSRLNADGIYPDEKQAVDFYAQEIKRLSGRILNPEDIRGHMDAADVITSFMFWHEYLHGNDVGRVRGIYGKMVEEADSFLDHD